MRLFLIRHGQTPHNVTGALDTAFPGAGLTPLGQSQARALPEALAEEDIAGIYASRLVRTQLTAAPLAESRGLDVHVREGLEEVAAGELELRADRDAVHAYAGCLVSWMCGDLERRMPGGTAGREFYDRYEAALSTIAMEHDPDDTVVVFSHGAAIRVYTALAAGLHPEVSTELRIMNTGMGLLEGHPKTGWELARWSSEPLGGLQLEDLQAHDVTGESAEEAIHEP
ncbi:MAG TPA: histidine phosphatase family protein [Nocardioidaceae bacterium]|nr:histidine phosphatase family protein [Nocardioidaceae bacterium]